jgi:hypothetical protein
MRIKKLIVGVTVLAAPAFAMAQSAEQLIQKYTPLVGQNVSAADAQKNANALVDGLRDGTKVTMKSSVAPTEPLCKPATAGGIVPPPVTGFGIVPVPVPVGGTVEFTPQTGKMGYGNVDNALTLAQGSLANFDIVTTVVDATKQRAVTASDVCVALVGGVVTTKAGTQQQLPGILKLRSEGWGWGEISKHPQVGAKL